jgi:hypothetical protein
MPKGMLPFISFEFLCGIAGAAQKFETFSADYGSFKRDEIFPAPLARVVINEGYIAHTFKENVNLNFTL